MEFCVLTKEEYRAFFDTCPQASFMQSVELSELKKEYGSTPHFVGVKEDGKVIAAAMVLENRAILGQKEFYSPRGLMVDYHNKAVLEFFVTNLKSYIKKQGGFMLIIDPNVLYRVRTPEGELIPENPTDDESVQNLLSLGFKHFGFNIYLDALQVRWCCHLPLDEDYETKKAKFSKQTRKNINSCVKKGLMVREGTMEDLEVMTEIFETTAKRRDFFSRSLSYYRNMYQHMKDLMTIYVAYLDPDVYYAHTEELLRSAQSDVARAEEKMAKQATGESMAHNLEIARQQVEKYTKELEKAGQFKVDYPNGKAVGCLLSIRSGREYLTLTSGVLMEYRSFTPKYLMYEHHIKEAYKEGFESCNFYGISGDFNPDNEYYGIYEFKKGFRPNVTEYIGQFELQTGWFYPVYKLLKTLKGWLRRGSR
ncbi:MAG: peptidoglycan bridge formation glycyltransferase FemA/FemB family protein [Clostridia bacterium]|nr:peptidoglycan bridge formation glycyltransferase FemA/FemB family protein [Clostridia bacterium]